MRRPFILVLTVAVALAACSDNAQQAAADSELARDLALVGQTPLYTEFQDTALTTAAQPAPATKRAPVRTASRPTPRAAPPVTQQRTAETVPAPATPVIEPAPEPAPEPARAPRARGFESGTTFALTTKSPVCTTNLPGDKITATLTAPVTGENGAYLPAGTTVVLEVASVTPGDKPENAQISLRVRSIVFNDQPISTEAQVAILSELERREVPRNKNADRRKVVTGAVAGAVLGQIMGRDTKSTVIGAAAGAAAGTAVAVAGRQYDACLPAGGTVRVTTSQPIVLGD